MRSSLLRFRRPRSIQIVNGLVALPSWTYCIVIRTPAEVAQVIPDVLLSCPPFPLQGTRCSTLRRSSLPTPVDPITSTFNRFARLALDELRELIIFRRPESSPRFSGGWEGASWFGSPRSSQRHLKRGRLGVVGAVRGTAPPSRASPSLLPYYPPISDG